MDLHLSLPGAGGGNEGQRADSSEKHHYNNNTFSRRGKIPGNSCGEPNGPEGGDGLEEYLNRRGILCQHQDKGSQEYGDEAEGGNGKGLENNVAAQGGAEQSNLL